MLNSINCVGGSIENIDYACVNKYMCLGSQCTYCIIYLGKIGEL